MLCKFWSSKETYLSQGVLKINSTKSDARAFSVGVLLALHIPDTKYGNRPPPPPKSFLIKSADIACKRKAILRFGDKIYAEIFGPNYS